MRKLITFAAAGVMAMGAATVLAQAVDPDVAGPARRAAGATADALGAPGVNGRIEQREERRDERRMDRGNPSAAAREQARAQDPDRWRYRWHNNQWWYWTPANRWMYYNNNNAWTDYNANTYVAPRTNYYAGRRWRGRYNTGYRGYVAPSGTYGATPYSNQTPAGNMGANLGAGIGAAANGQAGAQTGAEIGGAIGSGIGAARQERVPPAAEGTAGNQPGPPAASQVSPRPRGTTTAPSDNVTPSPLGSDKK